MPTIGYRSNNAFIDDSIFKWCIEKRKQRIHVSYYFISHIEYLISCDFIIVNPLIFSFWDWNKFICIQQKRYQHIKSLIVYEDIEQYVKKEPKLPTDCEVLWITEPEKDIIDIKEILNSFLKRR